jgi:hypothetical protein
VKQEKKYPIYGVMAEFDNPTDLLHAAQRTYESGYRKIDAYTPYPIEEVSEVIGFHRHHNKVPLICLIGGILGGAGGFALASSASALWYPLNIAGRPYIPWPMFIPITFECTVLIAGLSCAIGMLALNGLPEPYHPVFNVPGFSLATNNRFFLVIEARDPKYDQAEVMDFLRSAGAQEVMLVDG